jgi:hypothetical protein
VGLGVGGLATSDGTGGGTTTYTPADLRAWRGRVLLLVTDGVRAWRLACCGRAVAGGWWLWLSPRRVRVGAWVLVAGGGGVLWLVGGYGHAARVRVWWWCWSRRAVRLPVEGVFDADVR